jgi:hypothetical protein
MFTRATLMLILRLLLTGFKRRSISLLLQLLEEIYLYGWWRSDFLPPHPVNTLFYKEADISFDDKEHKI